MHYNIPLMSIIKGSLMKKVNLTMSEYQKYEVIKRLVDSNGNKARAALELGCTKFIIAVFGMVYLSKNSI